MVTRDVSKLEINKLTKAQFERELAAGQINPDALYMIPSSNAVANYTATIGTTWTGTEAPYTQDVAVAGILATDTPIVDLVEETQSDDLEAAWGAIYRIMAGTDKITVYSKEASIISIPIQIKVVR